MRALHTDLSGSDTCPAAVPSRRQGRRLSHPRVQGRRACLPGRPCKQEEVNLKWILHTTVLALTPPVCVLHSAHAKTRLITDDEAMRIEVPETTSRLVIVATQPCWATHRVMTFDLRIDPLEGAASRANSAAAVTSGTYGGALIGLELRRIVQMLRRRRLERAGPTPTVASVCQDAGTRRRLLIRFRSRPT